MDMTHAVPARPKLFVDFSEPGRRVAEILRVGLSDVADVTSACDGVAEASRTFDLAVFVLDGARDTNMLLRLGVFLGALGRERIVLIGPALKASDLPSELRDVTLSSYSPYGGGNDIESLSVVCETIKAHVERLATPAGQASLPNLDELGAPTVARRARRSLGTACSVRSGQKLRIVDISLSGALLETFGEIPEHQLLDLDLELDSGRRARVTAKVVRIQYPQWGRVGGVGVAFTRFAGDAQEVLAEYLDPLVS